MLRNNSATEGFRAKAFPGTEEYIERVAKPTMAAIDRMPAQWRRAVDPYGYVDTYRAWKRGWSIDDVRERADRNGGRFVLDA